MNRSSVNNSGMSILGFMLIGVLVAWVRDELRNNHPKAFTERWNDIY